MPGVRYDAVVDATSIGQAVKQDLVVAGRRVQILLAGAASILNDLGIPGIESLDLNRVTLVPAGGASSVPYNEVNAARSALSALFA